MHNLLILLVISACLAESAWAQPMPLPAARPAEALSRRAIAPVSSSPLPTFDHGTYQRVQAAMLGYASIEVRGGWPALPANARLAPGDSGRDVALLRRRLALADDLPPERSTASITTRLSRTPSGVFRPATGSKSPAASARVRSLR